MNESNEKEALRKIQALLIKYPGIHISKLAELLGVNIPTVQEYLEQLDRNDLLTSEFKKGYRQYFSKKNKLRTRNKRTEETRRQIYNIVSENPGLYLSKIAEMLDMSVQLTDYHLLYMERNKEIYAVKDPGEYHRRYYTADCKIRNEDKRIVKILSNEMLMKIILILLKNENMRHKDICEEIGVSSSRLSYHLNKLVKSGIVDVSSHGSDKGYFIKNKEELITILKKYQIQFGIYLSIDRFNSMWKDLNIFYLRKKR